MIAVTDQPGPRDRLVAEPLAHRIDRLRDALGVVAETKLVDGLRQTLA